MTVASTAQTVTDRPEILCCLHPISAFKVDSSFFIPLPSSALYASAFFITSSHRNPSIHHRDKISLLSSPSASLDCRLRKSSPFQVPITARPPLFRPSSSISRSNKHIQLAYRPPWLISQAVSRTPTKRPQMRLPRPPLLLPPPPTRLARPMAPSSNSVALASRSLNGTLRSP